MKVRKNIRIFVLVFVVIIAMIQLLSGQNATVAIISQPSGWIQVDGPPLVGPWTCWDTGRTVLPDAATAKSKCESDNGGRSCAYSGNGYDRAPWVQYYRCVNNAPYCDGLHCYDYHYLWYPGHPEYVQSPNTSTADLGGTSLGDASDADKQNLEGALVSKPRNQVCLLSSLDLKSGNVYHSQQLGPLTFSYNSLDFTTGPLGIGWTHDFNVSIISNADGSIFLRTGDGNRLWFAAGSGNTYHADTKSSDTSSIIKNADSSYTRTTRYGKIYNFDPAGKLTRITDRNENATILHYDGNELVGITDPAGRNTVIGMTGGKIVSVADFAGNPYTISYWPSGLISSITDPQQNSWHYEYDTNNMMTKKTDPSNNESSYTYDATTGKVISCIDPNNRGMSVAYDTASDSTSSTTRVTEKDNGVWTHKYYKKFNVPLEITDPLGNKTTYTYDTQGNLTSITYPDSTYESFAYDANTGNLTSKTDRRRKTIIFGYDAQKGGGGVRVTEITDLAGKVTHITYDTKSNMETITDRTGGVTRFQRDGNGNIIKVTDPLGHETVYEYENNEIVSITDPNSKITNLGRDMLGNVTSITDPLNHTTQFDYNGNAQLVKVRNHLQQETSFDYDPNGNVRAVTDPLRNPTTYAYNYRGQLTKRTDARGKDTLLAYTSTECASCNGTSEQISSVTDPLGAVTNFAYAYNLSGRLYTTTITDPLGKATTISNSAVTRQRTITDRNGNRVTYTYTPTGKLQAITYPDQAQVVYTYNDLDRPTRMQDRLGYTDYSYDDEGRITGQTDPHGLNLSFAYDLAGNITRITYPDGSKVTYTYDALNRLATVRNWLSDTVYDEASYTYDDAGNLASFTRFNGIRTEYSYDDANRLTDMASTVSEHHLILDANGSHTSSEQRDPLTAPSPAVGTTVYIYNSPQGNRLLSAAQVAYGYDDEGQLTSAGNTVLAFDYDHRLAAIGTGTQFRYDGRGNRLSVTRAGSETLYAYDPWGNLLATWDGTGLRKYIYGRGLIAMQTGSARYCYHFDPTGSTVALTDMSGSVVNSYAYDPFGVILARNESLSQPFTFVGQYGVMFEPEGLYYMRARYYDPNVGRFISEDPMGFDGGDVNLYAYVQNAPINWIDPWGLARTTIDAAIEQAAKRGDVGELRTLINAATSTEERAAIDNAIHRLTSKAGDIIAKECRGSINREFPGELRDKALEEIMKAAKEGDSVARKALKLLNDSRFKK